MCTRPWCSPVPRLRFLPSGSPPRPELRIPLPSVLEAAHSSLAPGDPWHPCLQRAFHCRPRGGQQVRTRAETVSIVPPHTHTLGSVQQRDLSRIVSPRDVTYTMTSPCPGLEPSRKWYRLFRVSTSFFLALASRLEQRLVHQKVGLIPSQDTYPGFGFDPQSGRVGKAAD